ncbi:MAG: 4-hydroxythreonine-4-phosphate dehydrogenase PdxA, partial [Candidatus Saccharicenans sp.]|nr:4-hydroxythreonine-4-phosphate dehydrogenase PdxA [Candidatus Saccharicenans sp.]
MSLPVIGLTLGDPSGVGAEIILRLFQNPNWLPEAKFIIFGQKRILLERSELLKLPAGWLINNPTEKDLILREIGKPLDRIEVGSPAAESGLASFSFFKAAVESAIKGEIQALVTAPISKISWQLAGIKFRGHTEYLEHLFPEAIMSFWSRRLRLALYTHHVPMKEALARIKKKLLLKFFLNLERQLRRCNLGIEELLVCGLNPHAGEKGSIGLEEEEEILPAVTAARSSGLKISGPFPADTIFHKVLDKPETMAVALYHDQALIPFKLVSFETGVNLTLGLPFVRTS